MPTASTSNIEMTTLPPPFHTPETFKHVITHVFFPVELPKENDRIIENDLALTGAVCAAAHAYTQHVCGTPEEDRWRRTTKMLDDLRASVQSEHLEKDDIVSQLRRMETGDIVTVFVRLQNAAIIITKRGNSTLFESFGVSPNKDTVEKMPGSLACSYPWSAVEIPNEIFDDEDFQSELAHFLSLPDTINSGLPRPSPIHQEYITALLSGILRGIGRTADVTVIPKRIRDNVGQWPRNPGPAAYQGDWRRSTLWLLIRVAIQMSTGRSSAGRAFYKQFILYFICTIARDRNNANLSCDLLHLMSSKIFRRLSKLEHSAPDWLSEMALGSCASLREILDTRWNELSFRRSPFRNPSQDELIRDTKLSLLNSGEYIRNVLSTSDIIRPRAPFGPNHPRRGTLEDFLSLNGAFFDEAYNAEPEVTMYDVEHSVEQEIDDWIAHVTQVDDGCARLDALMDRYYRKYARENPEDDSVKILTMVELLIAIDKLVVRDTPMFTDYSPGIPVAWLEKLCLRRATSLHRLACAYQYLVARESRSRPGWSAVSEEFNEDSFPVRYYDQSQHLQQLKARIEEDTKVHQDPTIQQCPAQDAKLFRPLSFDLPLHAKVIVFELQCPPCFRIWRSAITRIYSSIGYGEAVDEDKRRLIMEIPELQPYLTEHPGQPGPCLAYCYQDGSQSKSTPTLCYLTHESYIDNKGEKQDSFSVWRRLGIYSIRYSTSSEMEGYTDSTSHTSNNILAEQADCPTDFSLDEFITSAHLRSGALLQWLNILRGLRSRTLNLRREQIHFLLAHAAFQVGPLDLNTATWTWHQELQDTSFCNALIDELDDLFMDGAGLIDGVFMSTISLLLSRIIASSPSTSISKRAIAILQRIRSKTFGWVQELSYDLNMAPMNNERKTFLLRMATTCRNTFDVDRVALPPLIHSAEDVDALLSCSFLIHALRPTSWISNTYLEILLARDNRITHALEEIARDVILSDPSNRGVDLAVGRILVSYRHSAQRLKPLPFPNARWLTCITNAVRDQPSQMIHFNVLDGQLRLDSQPFGRLPREIRDHQEYKQIFINECFVVPSDLPGMDFMTLTVTPNYKVHLSLQDDNLVVRAQCNQTNQILQAIPSEILWEDLPPVLVDGHIHWLNTSSGVIEIRHRRQRWEPSIDNWRIDCVSESYYAHKGHESLVDSQSSTWAMLSGCFECLTVEERAWGGNVHQIRNILVTTCSARSMSGQQLVVTLPRHALSFFVNNREELESRDFKYMVYDEDQCVQTLFGLKDLLVLRPTTYVAGFSVPESLISRIALVPDGLPQEGKLSFNNYHPYHTFKVDPELGCLVGNGNPNNTRLLAYLHAMTSFHQPDPLLDKMGIQTACDFLRSAGCRSIMQVKALDEDKEASMDTVGLWSSTRYPQLNTAHEEIQNRYYWDRHGCYVQDDRAAWKLHGKRAEQRAIHLYPSSADKRTSLEANNHFGYAVPNSNQELEDVAFAASSAIRHSTPTMDTLSSWTKTWRANVLMDPISIPDRGPEIPTDSDIVRVLTSRVHDILERREGMRQQLSLIFLLPTLLAHCSRSHQTAFLSTLMAFTPQTNDLTQILAAESGAPTLSHQVSTDAYTSKRYTSTPLQVTLDQLLSDRQPPELPQRATFPRDGFQAIGKTSETWDDTPALDSLFSSLQTDSPFQQEYLALLGTSASARKEFLPTRRVATKDNDIDVLRRHYTKCSSDYVDAMGRLKKTLGPMTNYERTLKKFSHWPPVTANTLLRYLASTSQVPLSEQWRKCLVSFAQLLLELQRARRLLRFTLDDLEEEFSKELENEQCQGWRADDYPDWLLIQVQGDFLIRRAQAEIAMQLMFPQSRGNAVMQVNMGEGKSSIVIPIVAAALAADGKQLVRVIVPKALTTQMFDILVSRLGGLTNRPIYHLPFSRTAYNDHTSGLQVKTLLQLMSQCMSERGILLVQPEHVVSLKLMAVEKQIYGRNTLAPFPNIPKSVYQLITRGPSFTRGLSSEDSFVGSIFRWLGQSPNSWTTRDSVNASESDDAAEWLNLQKWVHSYARDILDESDEILHPRFQMIYTIGFEQHADGYPNRWTITGQILRLVKENLHTLSRTHPNSVEYERGLPGSFPRVHVVRASDVGQHLISMVLEDVMAGQLANFNFQQVPSAALRGAVRSFISDKDVLQISGTAKTVEEYAKHSRQSHLWNGLLLLRGLLSSNILLFALLERRWRVDYGHDQYGTSTMLAVPYRAKDTPAPNTQFGHPDLTIVLTYLSYYYTGLTEEQLQVSFEILLDMDEPAAEYESWIKDYESLPESLQKLSDINPRSSEEWDKFTFPFLSQNQAVIDFYLSQVVFPKEAKEFPWKLSGSSWDLAEKREKLVTGFSGTSDSRWLLPMSVIQHDLEHQRGTSASVLALLLLQEREQDSSNYAIAYENGQRQSTKGFLKLVAMQRPEIRVLLDVGAQILDLPHHQVAKAWLDIARDAEAAIYFNESDELTVLPRVGNAKALSSSPFSQQLGKCIVYLDHPHTRGTDLKFPIGSRAAVTLGPKVTKDALVQGCMRMRKLGHGHSVMFFAPPGVDQNIRAVTGKRDRDIEVTISDVLSWTIRETWADIQHQAPHWAQQGVDHRSRYDALSSFCNNELTPKHLADVWLQPNCKSLVDLYAPRETEDAQIDLSAVQGMQRQCKVLGILSLPNGQLEEEQEREVHREREREREVELPPGAEPAQHHLHPDVVSFVKSGIMHSDGAFLPVFTILERSTAAARDADVWSPSILATADFSRTIQPSSTKGTMDRYLRPVQWILSGKADRGPVLVILSPFEANLLMPDIRASKHVHLHLYAPRTAERMKPSDDLRLYVVPPLPSDWTPPWELIDQLNVFSGQLYLRNYESYLRLCRFLDVPTDESPSDGRVRRNLFHMPGTFEETEIAFLDSPLPSVMALLAIRNRGRPFGHTHMGKILQGQILTKNDFKGIRTKSTLAGRSPLPCRPLDMAQGDVPQEQGSSALHRQKRGPEMNSPAEDSKPSQKRARADEATSISSSPQDDAQDQPDVTLSFKRVLEAADTDQESLPKRPRAN